MELLRAGLTIDQAEQLVRGVAEAQYNLLLGAGFSMSAADKHGVRLPSGPGLSVEINKAFDLGFDDQGERNLPAVFEEARHAVSGEIRLIRFLKDRFVDTRPTWHGNVLDISWSRIWTLNIDDVFDQIHSDKHEFKVQPLSWLDELAPSSLGTQRVQVVHLHGRASTLQTSTQLVFTLREYAKAIRSQGDWHAEFWSQWLQRPFLVVGAKLLEEIDLIEAIARGNHSLKTTGFPTIAVIRDVDDLDRRRLARGNVIPIDADAEFFVAALQSDVACYRRKFEEMTREPMSLAAVARFNQQFEVLTDGRHLTSQFHDFYGGDEPNWGDVEHGLDGPRQVVSAATKALLGAAVKGDSGAVLLTGMAGAGKTTALLRLARNLVPHGFRIFRFRELERPDVDAIINWLRANPKSLLVFDNAADFAGNIRAVLEVGRKERIQCLVAAAERSKRAPVLQDDLRVHLVGSYEIGRVNRVDALAISKRRAGNARLGIATGWDDAKLWRYYQTEASGDLFMALSGLEQGRGFFSRLDQEWGRATTTASSGQIRTLRAVAIVHRLGYSLPLSVVIDVARRGIGDLGIIEGVLAELVELDARGLRYRHRMLAEHVFRQHVPVKDRYEISLAVVMSLAPLISERSLRQRTYPVLIVRQLMDKDSVTSMSASIQDARKWYETLQNDFDWNGRYWEQRALLESDAGVHEKAYSYAKKSIDVHRHAFSLNTLGRVRLKASVDPDVNVDIAFDYFLDGVASLSESVAHAQGFDELHEHPFMTFFSYVVEFSERLQPEDSRLKTLDQLRLEWRHNFERTGVKSSAVLEKMRQAQEVLLRSLVAKAGGSIGP
jgi:hypothetical protein